MKISYKFGMNKERADEQERDIFMRLSGAALNVYRSEGKRIEKSLAKIEKALKSGE